MAAPQLETLNGSRFGLIADAHVHPGKGPPLPASLQEIFKGADAIFALGDLGEASGLDTLEKIAPVKGVNGGDDAHGDKRLGGALRLFSIANLTVGALFDPEAHKLVTAKDPLNPVADFAAAAQRLFGRKIDVLLCASTHRPLIAWANGILIVDPGSPTLSESPSVAVLEIGEGYATALHHKP
jgi:predicted phosphodiesterase